MTAEEFRHKYHEYCAGSYAEAKTEADRANAELEPNKLGRAVPVEFPGLGWALMLEVSANTVVDIGMGKL